jgi:hypothetical protein
VTLDIRNAHGTGNRDETEIRKRNKKKKITLEGVYDISSITLQPCFAASAAFRKNILRPLSSHNGAIFHVTLTVTQQFRSGKMTCHI